MQQCTVIQEKGRQFQLEKARKIHSMKVVIVCSFFKGTWTPLHAKGSGSMNLFVWELVEGPRFSIVVISCQNPVHQILSFPTYTNKVEWQAAHQFQFQEHCDQLASANSLCGSDRSEYYFGSADHYSNHIIFDNQVLPIVSCHPEDPIMLTEFREPSYHRLSPGGEAQVITWPPEKSHHRVI